MSFPFLRALLNNSNLEAIFRVHCGFTSLAKPSKKVLVIQKELFPGLPRGCVAIARNDGLFLLSCADIFAKLLHFRATFIKPEHVFDLFNKAYSHPLMQQHK